MTWTVEGPGDTTTHATIDDALKAAAEEIERCLDHDGWSCEVKDIRIKCDGNITHRAVEVLLNPPETDEDDDPPSFDYYCDYEMQQVNLA